MSSCFYLLLNLANSYLGEGRTDSSVSVMMKTVHVKLMLCFISTVSAVAAAAAKDDGMIYIIHMDKSEMPTPFSYHEEWYQSTVSSITKGRAVDKQMDGPLLYVYDKVMHGFSAKLKQSEVDALHTMPGYIASHPYSKGKLDTTRSIKFLGLKGRSGIWPRAELGNKSDIIIGVLDTGIWPESESFKDNGMSDIPAKWKGQCQPGTAFNSSLCNRKLIGARYFKKGFLAQYGYLNTSVDYDSARDYDGHGSHVSSTAAGNFVDNADFFGYAEGTAKGVAPRARVAMYKVAWFNDIIDVDVLAAIESAISDGVDILSLSMTLDAPDFYKNLMAIAAFAAVEKGMLLSCSAHNTGPYNYTVQNGAPWILTVGSGTIDRAFIAKVKLGNGQIVEGTSLFTERIAMSGIPITYGNDNSSRACAPNSLDPKKVAGKILLCMNDYWDSYTPLLEANRTEPAGVIVIDYLGSQYPKAFWMPTVSVTSEQARLIADYVMSTDASNATADIKFVITQLGSKPAPTVSYWSSRGPNRLTPGILKPDVIAPGVNILAAWVPNVAASYLGTFSLESDYGLASGTSMACPHAAGVAALVKAIHPDWSPAAIKSALITTAHTQDNTGHVIVNQLYPPVVPATPLDFGAGMVNPNKAADPGLVYDSDVNDYINYLCALNYTKKEIRIVTRREYSCSGHAAVGDLNYPSFLANFTSSGAKVERFKRIVSNVADDNKIPYLYRAIVKAPPGVSVEVEPDYLLFKERNEKLGFSLSLEVRNGEEPKGGECVVYGYLSWVDGRGHVVTSPLVVLFC